MELTTFHIISSETNCHYAFQLHNYLLNEIFLKFLQLGTVSQMQNIVAEMADLHLVQPISDELAIKLNEFLQEQGVIFGSTTIRTKDEFGPKTRFGPKTNSDPILKFGPNYFAN